MTVPVWTVALFTGLAPPISMASKTPVGAEPLTSSSAVTTAKPRLLVPRSGSMAIAIGEVSMEMEVAVKEVAGEEPVSNAKLISETVLLPVLATSAAPVPSSIATPVGVVPTVTAATFCVPVSRVTVLVTVPVAPSITAMVRPR